MTMQLAFGWARAPVLALALGLAACGGADEIEVRGKLVIVQVDGGKGFLQLIETAPGKLTRFYVSPGTKLVNVARVEGKIQWEWPARYLVRGRKTTNKPDPSEGDVFISYPGVTLYLDATHVEKIAAN